MSLCTHIELCNCRNTDNNCVNSPVDVYDDLQYIACSFKIDTTCATYTHTNIHPIIAVLDSIDQ